jgi:hypothetical protein
MIGFAKFRCQRSAESRERGRRATPFFFLFSFLLLFRRSAAEDKEEEEFAWVAFKLQNAVRHVDMLNRHPQKRGAVRIEHSTRSA